MKTDMLALADALSDQDLMTRLKALAADERASTVDLVVHLAALLERPSAYAAQGYGSLFAYCTQALRLSEDAGCNRIEAARACRRFPTILGMLSSGALSLTSVRLIARHLTPENQDAVLARASGRSRREIEALAAELSPRPDVASTVRMLPRPKPTPPAPLLEPAAIGAPEQPAMVPERPIAVRREQRPVVKASAPERYRVQFTIGPETHARLRRLQALLRREIPDGDTATIVDRALILLEAEVERKKLARTKKARRSTPAAIRPGTDNLLANSKPASRHVPNAVARIVWERDGMRCAFVSEDGRRCTEQAFLELHHIHPYALRGPATVENLAVRCREHNQYESELVFGTRQRKRHLVPQAAGYSLEHPEFPLARIDGS